VLRRVCDLETSRIGAPYIYDISSLRVEVLCSVKNNCGTSLIGDMFIVYAKVNI